MLLRPICRRGTRGADECIRGKNGDVVRLSGLRLSINDINHVSLPGCFDRVDVWMKTEKMKETREEQKVVGISSLTC